MFVDGLWVSGMTLHVYRDGAPIPKEMQDSYIKLELTQKQIMAIAALLGLGYRDGEILCYNDDAIERNILRNDGFGFQSEYYHLCSEDKRSRKAVRISKSFASSDAGQNVSVIQSDDGIFDFVTSNKRINDSNDTHKK